MAALALKDAGIEVIAVGNGEAAVRKLREVSPDLVLADIFMPVRNGYEVCEFVKHDPKYSNIPVLLLAGAFDPFDEREAQRVQADGILKKPFVPPDPLINAVKTLLEKSAAERLMAVTVPAEASAAATAESAPSEAGSAVTAVPEAIAAEPSALPELDPEGQAYAEPLSVVDFVTNSAKETAKEKPQSLAPLASFELPQVDEPEPVVTASRDPVLGEPAFWVAEEPEQAAAETAEDSDEDLTDHTWGSSGRPAPMREDPDPPPMMLELEPPRAAVHDFDLADFAAVETEQLHEAVKEALPEPLAPELSTFELPTLPAAPVTPHVPEPVPAASIADSVLSSLPTAFAAPETHAASAAPLHAAEPSVEDTLPLPETMVDSTALEMTPLDSPLPQPETKLTEAEPAAMVAKEDAESSLLELEESSPAFAQGTAPAVSSAPEPGPAIQRPALRQESSEPNFASDWPPTFVPVTSTNAHEAQPPSLEVSVSSVPLAIHHEAEAEPAPEPATVAALSPEAQETVIQRVIERMQPQIVELVTRQILRPLVESLVRSELSQK